MFYKSNLLILPVAFVFLIPVATLAFASETAPAAPEVPRSVAGDNSSKILSGAGETLDGKAAKRHEDAVRLENEGKKPEAEQAEREAKALEAQAKAMKDASQGCQKAADAAKDEGGGGMPPPAPPAAPPPPEEEKKETAAAPTPAPTQAVVQSTPAPASKPDPQQQALLAQIDQLKKTPAPSSSPVASQATTETDAKIAAMKTQEANQMANYAQSIIDQQNAVRAPDNRIGEPVVVAAAEPKKPTMAEQLVTFDQRKQAARAMME